MKRFEAIFPWLVLFLAAGWIASKAMPPRTEPGKVDYYRLGLIPVRDQGRIMPMDTLARTALQSISGRTEVIDEKGNVVATAMQWLAQIFDHPDWLTGEGAKYKIFRIEHDQLLAMLELPRRPGFFRYSLAEIAPAIPKFQEEVDKVEQKRAEEKPLDFYDAKIEDLNKKLRAYRRLSFADDIQPIPPPAAEGDWTSLGDADRAAVHFVSEKQQQAVEEEQTKMLVDLITKNFGGLDQVPEAARASLRRRYQKAVDQALMQEAKVYRGQANPAAGAFTELLQAARSGNGEGFDAKLADYRINTSLRSMPISNCSPGFPQSPAKSGSKPMCSVTSRRSLSVPTSTSWWAFSRR